MGVADRGVLGPFDDFELIVPVLESSIFDPDFENLLELGHNGEALLCILFSCSLD